MCIDYSDLNKTCPKDTYPLPCIDWLVDNTTGYELLSFLDAYSGYNQIWMYPPNEEKMTFMTNRASYCYRVMHFGLKNAGAMYQRLMDRVFWGTHRRHHGGICGWCGCQVNNHRGSPPSTWKKVLGKVQNHNLRLNLGKCFFAIGSEKFLSFMITHIGIEANLDNARLSWPWAAYAPLGRCSDLMDAWWHYQGSSPSWQRKENHSTNFSKQKRSLCGTRNANKPLQI